MEEFLGTPRRHFAGAERGSRITQILRKPSCGRVRAAKHAPRDGVAQRPCDGRGTISLLN